ncbi:DUF3150 domain-containing protein [Sinirhodobacter populi]|uniref:DUF3150 domain-containing protein n=1 Tax=Paenirhodobacter populi TaxID=2306993 RepID=A0A443KCN3_9RHOB|nr:DUF3150 domain-containing protein [Sinirhodobacter populi]RWR30571.1 DUF3150 domain-containing protein [Sinirhodobacter populi]
MTATSAAYKVDYLLKNIVLVMPMFSVWSGSGKLEPSDFTNVDADDLPPETVAKLGLKRLINRDALSPFTRLRARADRLCEEYGTRFMGGFAIPEDYAPVVAQKLADLVSEFNTELDTFLRNYDKLINDWVVANPDMAQQILRAVKPRDQIKRRFNACYAIAEVNGSAHDHTNSMVQVADGLFDSFLKTLIDRSVPLLTAKNGTLNDTFRSSVRNSLQSIADKIERFAFLDPSKGGMMVLASKIRASVVGEGTIRGEDFMRVWNTIQPLKSADAFVAAVTAMAGEAPVIVAPPVSQPDLLAPFPTSGADSLGSVPHQNPTQTSTVLQPFEPIDAFGVEEGPLDATFMPSKIDDSEARNALVKDEPPADRINAAPAEGKPITSREELGKMPFASMPGFADKDNASLEAPAPAQKEQVRFSKKRFGW